MRTDRSRPPLSPPLAVRIRVTTCTAAVDALNVELLRLGMPTYAGGVGCFLTNDTIRLCRERRGDRARGVRGGLCTQCACANAVSPLDRCPRGLGPRPCWSLRSALQQPGDQPEGYLVGGLPGGVWPRLFAEFRQEWHDEGVKLLLAVGGDSKRACTMFRQRVSTAAHRV
jgi:hypothetical protein